MVVGRAVLLILLYNICFPTSHITDVVEWGERESGQIS